MMWEPRFGHTGCVLSAVAERRCRASKVDTGGTELCESNSTALPHVVLCNAGLGPRACRVMTWRARMA